MDGHLARVEVLDEPPDVLLLDGGALRLVLDDVRLLHLDDPHGRHGLLLQPQELDHAPVVVLVRVDDHELHLKTVTQCQKANVLITLCLSQTWKAKF